MFERPDPVGYSLRTFLASAIGARTSCSATWNKRATPAGRSWWVLSMSARPTSGTVSGSWHSPVAGDSKDVPYRNDQGDKSKPRLTNLGLCRQNWPTPRAEDSEQTGAHGGVADTLTSASRLWPTPAAQDGERGPERTEALQARGGGGKNPALAGAVVFGQWQTPTTQPARQNSYPDAPHIKRPSLQDQAEGVWPTPMAHEARLGYQGRTNPDAKGSLKSLTTFAVDAVGPCPPAPTSTRGKPRGSLNPAWVTQLMGLPDGWLDLPDETLSRLSATARSPKSSRKSAA